MHDGSVPPDLERDLTHVLLRAAIVLTPEPLDADERERQVLGARAQAHSILAELSGAEGAGFTDASVAHTARRAS